MHIHAGTQDHKVAKLLKNPAISKPMATRCHTRTSGLVPFSPISQGAVLGHPKRAKGPFDWKAPQIVHTNKTASCLMATRGSSTVNLVESSTSKKSHPRKAVSLKSWRATLHLLCRTVIPSRQANWCVHKSNLVCNWKDTDLVTA